MDRDDIVVMDCSVEITSNDDGSPSYHSGQSLFESGHIPNARHADLITDLSDPTSAMLCPLPTAQAFRDKMALLGVGDNTTVILYDRSFTAWAARVWWMLRWIGFDNAMILNGGLNAWIAERREVSTNLLPHEPRTLSLDVRPEMIAQQNDVQAAVIEDSARLIDTLSSDNFNGAVCDYHRPGHILGAVNVFTLDLFDEKGLFKPLDVLAKMHAGDKAKQQITYCGAGILASATAFVMVQLGYEDVSVYTSSLQEWAVDPTNPMMTKQ